MNTGTVDLIATEPPSNKSNDVHATPHNLASDARFTDSINFAISSTFRPIFRAKLVATSVVDLR